MDQENNMFNKIIKINSKPDSKIPDNVKLKENQVWCPYCSNIVVFIKDKSKGVKKCPYCSISDRDYNVRKINKLWIKGR